MNILQEIFKQHYEEMLYILLPNQHVIDTVDRMINCGDPAFGGAMYGCTKCGELKFVPFVAILVFALLVAISIPWTAPTPWLLNLSPANIAIVYLPFPKNSGTTF